jgi:hypothetical protein
MSPCIPTYTTLGVKAQNFDKATVPLLLLDSLNLSKAGQFLSVCTNENRSNRLMEAYLTRRVKAKVSSGAD